MSQNAPSKRSTAPASRLGWVMLAGAQVAMSSGALFGRLALERTDAAAVAACRMVIASVPLLLRVAWTRRRLLRPAVEGKLLAGGGLLCLQFLLWTSALSRLSVGTTTLLACATPLYNGLFERFVLGRRLHPHFWWAMALAAAGIACIVQSAPPADVPLPGEAPLGVALALGCSFASACGLALMRHLSTTEVAAGRADSLELVARTFGWAAAALVALAALSGAQVPHLDDTRTWAGIAGMALVTQSVGHTLQNVAVRYLPASVVSFATLVEPLLATLMAAALFGEAIGVWTAAGGALVLGALGWAMRLTAAASGASSRA